METKSLNRKLEKLDTGCMVWALRLWTSERLNSGNLNSVSLLKSVRIRSYSGPYFPAFGLNTERHGVSLHIQSEYRKCRPE